MTNIRRKEKRLEGSVLGSRGRLQRFPSGLNVKIAERIRNSGQREKKADGETRQPGRGGE